LQKACLKAKTEGEEVSMPSLLTAIMLLINQQSTPLISPTHVDWTLKNDRTERPSVGKTESWIDENAHHVVMSGYLASLPSPMGCVGFSLMETKILQPLTGSEGLAFSGRGTPEAVFSILVKDAQWEQPEGTLTFQWDFETQGQFENYSVTWDQFTPKIRGKKVSGFTLDVSTIHSLSFQISRSAQKKWYDQNPLKFEWEI
jgi:Complex I intermediate-associated protein 30 (CIA30)